MIYTLALPLTTFHVPNFFSPIAPTWNILVYSLLYLRLFWNKTERANTSHVFFTKYILQCILFLKTLLGHIYIGKKALVNNIYISIIYVLLRILYLNQLSNIS